MGWERKRGKLAEFNRLLRGATDTSFAVQSRRSARSAGVRYVITLDSDTQLPMEAARAARRHARAPAEPAAVRSGGRPRDGGLRRAAAARGASICVSASRTGVRAGVLRTRRRRSLHHRRVGRLSRPLPRGQLRRQGHLRRRCLRGGAATAACPRTRCSATTSSKASTRGPGCAPTSTWSTITRRTTWHSPPGSTGGCAATGRSCAGCGGPFPTPAAARCATRCR